MNLRRQNRGFGVLIVLMAIAIMMLLYLLEFKGLESRQIHSNKPLPGTEMPWQEEWRLRQSGLRRPGDAPDMPASPLQPKIIIPQRLTAEAREQDEPRGQVNLVIEPSGGVSGSWSGRYESEGGKASYEILQGTLEGNTDNTKSGSDPSQLFFIAAGRYRLQAAGRETPREGYLYLTGWLDTNYHATGKLYLTPDKVQATIFTWQAQNP